MLIVMTATTVSLSVNSMSGAMIDNFTEGIGVPTTIRVDWDWARNHMTTTTIESPDGSIRSSSNFNAIEIPIELYVAFADSIYVQDFLSSAMAQYASDDIVPAISLYQPLTLEKLMAQFNAQTYEELVTMFQQMGSDEDYIESLIDAKPTTVGMIWGFSKASLMGDFRRGEKRLLEGRFFEDLNETVISSELAAKNNIKLGDIITVSGNSQTHDKETINLTVVGMFEDIMGEVQPQLGVAQEITPGIDDLIVSFDTLYNAGFHRIDPSTMTYFLTHPEVTAAFLSEMQGKGLHEMFMLDYDLDEYYAVVDPVRDMSGIAVTFGIVILITGAVILVFLSVINIRERKYEVGVLRAIGMKKHQLARGMIYESLTLVTLCTLIGLPLGVLLSRPIAGILLDTSSGLEMAREFSAGILSLLLAVAVILGIISSFIGILYITKYEPIRILQERT
ncbi:MAG: ABC transporter permease [Oscillospiraceae bacterium]|nr:ABC transporter permease [Oscillospiraceae bacterium]